MTHTTIHRLACDYCRTTIRSRADERYQALRERAEHSGWRQIYATPSQPWRDACQVCAPKVSGLPTDPRPRPGHPTNRTVHASNPPTPERASRIPDPTTQGDLL